ncbi:glycoside hydrolase family 3 N-terminal domain-containing protein [Fictibacillus sp. B-59209]|uniref:glycoside hydrolase family 3 protein n=1 Tax=Fictibacillus sp. B-59209 TaxID=3024873 RepID=UPI002E1C40E9|nr:glycoside hydrolase family 3 N-terminal domain-containing protein [Fictibacillus sp. B-59209]
MKKVQHLLIKALLMASLFILSAAPAYANENESEKGKHNMNVRQLISKMTMEEKVGQLVMSITHRSYDDPDGMPDEQTEKLIKDYKVGSVIVYNKRNPTIMANYSNQLQKWASETRMSVPLLVSADLEYGVTHNIKEGTTSFPREMGLGASRNIADAKTVAAITSREAKAMGLNWNYSPVADVNTNPNNPVIGVRSFGENTELVSNMASTMVQTYQKTGMIASAKHFPGHGDTDFDSHLGLASVSYDRKTLEEVHLPPFQAAIDSGVESIMTSHVIIKAIDPELPATLSPKVLTGLLRDEMGYNGIIVTDAMDMYAISKNWGAGEAAVMAIKAGADVIMSTGAYADQVATYNALLAAVKSGAISKERLDQSVTRILKVKKKYKLFSKRFVNPDQAEAICGNPLHQAVAEKIGNDSITLVKNDGTLPIKRNQNERYFLAGVTETDVVGKQLKDGGVNVSSWQSATANPAEADIQKAIQLSETADRLIALTYSQGVLPEGQKKLVEALRSTGKPVIVVSLGLPYDLIAFPSVNSYVTAYAIDRWKTRNQTAISAAVNVLLGSQPGGKLPVTINEEYPYGHGLRYGNQ